MKVISGNNIFSIAADKTDTGFPIEAMLTEHTGEVWRSTDSTGKITLSASKGSSIAIFGTNAKSIKITTGGGSSAKWSLTGAWSDDGAWYDEPQRESLPEIGIIGSASVIWVDYPERLYNHEIIIDLESLPFEKLYAGVIIVGQAIKHADPINVSAGIKTYDQLQELNKSGAYYHKTERTVRTFSVTSSMARDRIFFDFFYGIFLKCGLCPMAWKLSDNLTDLEFCLYARFSTMPSAEISVRAHLSINLLEVI